MGSRGAAREREYYRDKQGKFVRYGEEYVTLLQHGRIKFVTTKYYNVTAPRETRTEGRVYVTVSKNGNLKCITFYRKDGRLRIQIDLDHIHNGQKPHKHIGYNHSKDGIMKKSDYLMVERIKRIWEKEKPK